ncbi:hypothetical protein JOM56_004797, partial [Amanita muscaria]
RVFKFAEEFYAENKSNLALSPCLVITGQPGIGKSLWRWYALRKCCAQKKPVIFYSDNTCWLFVDEGVFEQPTSFRAQYYKTVIWTLVDSVDTPSGPPIRLTEHGSRHFVTYTTSPTPSRWNKLHQSMERAVCVMNPWTKAEIHKAAPFRAPGVSLTAIDAIFSELGPIPRLCFGDEESLIGHRKKLRTALRQLTLRDLEDMPTTGEDLSLDAVSHTIYVLRRSGEDVDSVEVDVMILSPFIASRVAHRLRALERHELVRLFKRYIALSSTRRMAGDVFEAYCHIIFSTRIDFDFVPMVRIGGRPIVREKMNPQWFSSHIKFEGTPQSEVELLHANALTSGASSLGIPPSRVVDYGSDEVAAGLQVETDVYYIPVKPNQVGIDSFILHNDHLYLFHMTVSDTHGISDELMPFLGKLKGLPSQSFWRFIFVKPPHQRLACLVPRSPALWDVDLYSAEIEVRAE